MAEKDTIIVAKNLVKRFGDVTAVNDISFEVKKGQIFAFLGPNGAGKSTTIKMMTTMLRPTSGILKLAGHDVATERDSARKRRCVRSGLSRVCLVFG